MIGVQGKKPGGSGGGLGGILGAIGGVLAAPFTGGLSLGTIGGLSGLGSTVGNAISPATPGSQGVTGSGDAISRRLEQQSGDTARLQQLADGARALAQADPETRRVAAEPIMNAFVQEAKKVRSMYGMSPVAEENA